MKLSQKKTCNGCRAYPLEVYKSVCQLGVSIKRETVIDGVLYRFRPQDPCYKPLKTSDFVSLLEANNA